MKLDDIEITLVTFNLGKELFGIQLHQLREIIRLPEIIHIPNAPSFIEGIINLRGSVVCVMDLHKRLNIEKVAEKKSKRIIIVDIVNRTVGLIVDKVNEVVYLQSSKVEPIPPEMSTLDTRFLKGVGKFQDQFILVVDIDKMLSTDELLKLDKK